MKNAIILFIMSSLVSACSYFHVHKIDVQQGNIITQENVSRLHRGMSTEQVKAVMGTPMLVNLFSPSRIDYVYSLDDSNRNFKVTRLTCVFSGGRLQEIIRS